MKYNLTYPSGTATAYLINCFHTPKGAKLAKKQVGSLFKTFGASFIFAAVEWIFAREEGHGFGSIPTFGSQAYAKRFYFDFSSTYIGVGMLCPYMVNISLLIGAIVSWAIMWPMIEEKKGDWYSAKLSATSLHGIQGYRVFIAIAMMLGDGLFHFVYMLVVTISSFTKRKSGEENYSVISIIVVPIIFHSLKWYHVLVAYLIAPILAFCNSYGAGLTDWSLASNYGKIAILTFSYWVGLENGGVIAGLASCGLMMSIVDTTYALMGDFKAGYLTLTSPRSMFFSQLIGTAMGCVITPLVLRIFNNAYRLGDQEAHTRHHMLSCIVESHYSEWKVLEVSQALPQALYLVLSHCYSINLMTQLLEKFETKYRIYRFIPSPMCMAIPFYLGGYFAIDMCVGSLLLLIWQRYDKRLAKILDLQWLLV
ncbi:hypothetical protein K7X08_029871 [Anisodus acutangulus]|uniref:Metal-nicotianamine transporter YSL7 n=1 Tax=Anisodus acutangulus TaxID=402998 RepID=A0A9Q1M167_9SOLA|nr:hypothetical protein K7X08_029871 [Anisodus acutangulus]